MPKSQRKLSSKIGAAPPEIIAVCERPGYLDHLQGGKYRVTLEAWDGSRWKLLCEEQGEEVWLLEYPPSSMMAHYCILGAKNQAFIKPPRESPPDPDIPF